MTIDLLPVYQCFKRVRAAQIVNITPNTLDLRGGIFIEVSTEWLTKHTPHIGGYYVVYDDGYASFSPASAFESGYVRIDSCH